MNETSVQNILEQIDRLSEEDRELLERALAEQAEAEWLRVKDKVRRIAQEKDIDEAAIDAAIHKRRYGS